MHLLFGGPFANLELSLQNDDNCRKLWTNEDEYPKPQSESPHLETFLNLTGKNFSTYCETPGHLQASKTPNPPKLLEQKLKSHSLGPRPQNSLKKSQEMTKTTQKIAILEAFLVLFYILFSRKLDLWPEGIFKVFSRNFGARGFGSLQLVGGFRKVRMAVFE